MTDDEGRRRAGPANQLFGGVCLPGERVEVIGGLLGEAEAEKVEGQRRLSPSRRSNSRRQSYELEGKP